MARKKPEPEPWPLVFLRNIALGWSVTKAAALAGVHRQTPYDHAKVDQTFAEAWQDAKEAAVDRVRDEVMRRAVEGIEEPVFYMGKRVDSVRKYDTTLLIFHAKKLDPAYRDNNSVVVTGQVEHSVSVLPPGVQPVEIPAAQRRAAALALLGAGEPQAE